MSVEKKNKLWWKYQFRPYMNINLGVAKETASRFKNVKVPKKCESVSAGKIFWNLT